MSAGDAPTIRCAGCGAIYPARYLRCEGCKTPTRLSRLHWQRTLPPMDKPIKWGCVLPLAAAVWTPIGALIWWAYG